MGTLVLFFIFSASAGVLTNLVGNYLQEVLDDQHILRRLTKRQRLALFGGVFLAMQIPAFVLANSVAVHTELEWTVATSSGFDWIPCVLFSAVAAYVSGYYWDTEVRANAEAGHCRHLAIGATHSAALAPITVPTIMLGLGVADPRTALFYHSLVPIFLLACPAFLVAAWRHTYLAARERSDEAVGDRLSRLERDVQMMRIEDDDPDDD